MAPSRAFLSIFVTVCLPWCAFAESFLRASGVTLEEVRDDLLSELSSTGSKEHDERLLALQTALSNTYKALPKSEDGTLNHAVVRFVLHRFFMQRHGWFIKGLEPNGPIWDPSKSPNDGSMKEWVPAYLENYLETSAGGQGIDLRKLAVLAATLEDLIKAEAHNRLSAVYKTMDTPTKGDLTIDQARDILGMYMVVYLVGGNLTVDNPLEATQKLHRFQQKYTGYAEVAEWSEGVWKDVAPKTPWLLKPTAEAEEEQQLQEQHQQTHEEQEFTVDVAATTRFVEAMGERFGTFNDLECRSLKETLVGMEGPKPGRVRLSDFYSKALYSHWKFNEKVEYLRMLGALDESDPKEIQVILPNYIGARPNCLEASGFYAICCRNECEDLMGYLEQKIAAPSASVERVVELVFSFSRESANMTTARLTESVLRRLREVADSNAGEVPLHGRLFAQWMHHVFPRECPYPHEAGTTSPQTPDEWMKETGQGKMQASEEEMQCYVDMKTWLPTGGCSGGTDDTASGSSGSPGAGGVRDGASSSNSQELPWTATEELLVVHGSDAIQAGGRRLVPVVADASGGTANWLRGLTLACVVSGVVLAVRILQNPESVGKAGLLQSGSSRIAGWWVTLGFFFFPMLILTLDYTLEALLPQSLQLSSSAGEAIQVAACWGLLAAIVHRLVMEFGLPSRKELSALLGSSESREKYMV